MHKLCELPYINHKAGLLACHTEEKQVEIRPCRSLAEASVKASVSFTVRDSRLVYNYPLPKIFNPKTMAYIAHDQSVNHITSDSHDDVTEPKILSIDKTLTTVFDKEEENMAFKTKTVFDEEILGIEETSSNENSLCQSNH